MEDVLTKGDGNRLLLPLLLPAVVVLVMILFEVELRRVKGLIKGESDKTDNGTRL